MRRGRLTLAVDRLLPVRRLTRLAVDYANLKALNANALQGLIRKERPVRGHFRSDELLGVQDPELWDRWRPRSKWAEKPDSREWVRELMEVAAGGHRLNEDQDTALYELLEAHRPELSSVNYDRTKGFRAWVEMPAEADLLWYIGLGCAALLDRNGPYKGLVRRCENFDGSGHETSKACHSYVLMQSEGGRKPSRFCSRECQNRVNQRNKDRKRRQLDRRSARP